ncbi:hypothetical protein [Streptomyces spirodelae]|uniref:Uncharacterized protein n=1 Tax=Streptomyces spirodelae TaxID=2812904 RepID=A0ABS3WXP7_9ACTN|nr:hypothetical protein [Streptomyces spirodelae]MBO8187892.1 hypothetical protein [Streptomyces spirodelae]
MFLDTLEAVGTFFGGLGALVAATTQLLTFLQKKDEEDNRELGSHIVDDESAPWMKVPGPVVYLTAAA